MAIGDESRQTLKLGDTVFYYRRHGEQYEVSPAIVVLINDQTATPNVGLWAISHPIANEAYPLFWRANVPFRDHRKLPTPTDGSHFWTWR
jgi:hypothetical protein